MRTTNAFYPLRGGVDGEVDLWRCELDSEHRLFPVMWRLMDALRNLIPLIPCLDGISTELGKKAKKGWSHYGALSQGANWRAGDDVGNVVMGFAVHLLAGATVRSHPHSILRLNLEHAGDLLEIVLGLIWWTKMRHHVRGDEFRQTVLSEIGSFMYLFPKDAAEMERLWLLEEPVIIDVLTWEPVIIEVIAAMEALLLNVPQHFPWYISSYDKVRWRAAFVGIQDGTLDGI